MLSAAGGRLASDSETSSEVHVPSVVYGAGGNAPLRIYRDAREVEFLSRMQAAPFRFRDVAWTYSGPDRAPRPEDGAGEGAAAAVPILNDARGHAVLVDPAASDHWRPALLSGGEVIPFAVRRRDGGSTGRPIAMTWRRSTRVASTSPATKDRSSFCARRETG